MTTRQKTVTYAFPALASLTDAVLTTLTQITVYIPESGLTFRNVTARMSWDDIITATGGTVTEWRAALRLGAAGYTTNTNLNDIANSGENMSAQVSADFTAHFATNWSGSSMTCDFQAYVDQSTGTTLNLVNVCVTLEITYDYDDTSATQIKTVLIPLATTTGALGTTKPGSANATIPALDTWLPELSKAYRSMYVVMQGNEGRATATTDHTLQAQIDTYTQLTSGNMEGSLASDRYFRYVWNISGLGMTTNATHGFYLWASVARCHHLQAYLVVTYEFAHATPTAWAATTAKSVGDRVYSSSTKAVYRCTTAGTTGGTEPSWGTTIGGTTNDNSAVWTMLGTMNSVMLPIEIEEPLGGTTSSDYQRGSVELNIMEPATITKKESAAFVFYSEFTALNGFNMRVNAGTFAAVTESSGIAVGSRAAMLRCENDITLVRGKNTITFDAYRTGTATGVLGAGINGFLIINYESGLSSKGPGAHNHTCLWALSPINTDAGAVTKTVAATSPALPETEYYLSNIGTEVIVLGSSGISASTIIVAVERLAGESGVRWETISHSSMINDNEAGVYPLYGANCRLFKRHPNDPSATRFDLETARRWRVLGMLASTSTLAFYAHLGLLYTYHGITGSVSGTVSGSGGGTVNIDLFRDDTDDKVAATSRVGNGSYSLTWYDNTVNVYTVAREDSTHLGRSDNDVMPLAA